MPRTIPLCFPAGVLQEENRKTRLRGRRPRVFILSLLLLLAVQTAGATGARPLPDTFAPVQPPTKSLPAGAVLYIRLDTRVSTSSSKVGQGVKAHVVRQIFDGTGVVVPLGATIQGKVEKIAKSANSNTPAVMLLDFTKLTVPGERPFAISCHLHQVDNARETVLSDGSILGVKGSQLPSTYVDDGLAKLSKSLPSLGALIQDVQKKQVGTPDTDISYPAGTDMELVLDKPVAVEKLFPPAVPEELPSSLRGTINSMLGRTPQRSRTKNGQAGDPVNLLLIGSETEITKAFKKAGWTVPAVRRSNSVLKTVQSVIQGQGYDTAPISNLYLYGRPQDLAFEKLLNTFSMRHHLRLWLSPRKTRDGRPIWIGAAVHDTGYDVHPGVASHATSPDLDAERAKVGADLIDTGLIAAVQLLTPPHPLSKGFTGTGGAWHTDGRLLAIDFRGP
jgi:hypothetical protein